MRINRLPAIGNNESKGVNLTVSVILLTGVSVLVFTLLYLLFHLEISDKIIYKCIPGFAFGLTSIFLYSVLFNKNESGMKRNHSYSIALKRTKKV